MDGRIGLTFAPNAHMLPLLVSAEREEERKEGKRVHCKTAKTGVRTLTEW